MKVPMMRQPSWAKCRAKANPLDDEVFGHGAVQGVFDMGHTHGLQDRGHDGHDERDQSLVTLALTFALI